MKNAELTAVSSGPLESKKADYSRWQSLRRSRLPSLRAGTLWVLPGDDIGSKEVEQESIPYLGILVNRNRATAEELGTALNIDSNQGLAGVLSGISKKAGAMNIAARAVYTVEDERKGGILTKTYAVALDFQRMAGEMNWPETRRWIASI